MKKTVLSILTITLCSLQSFADSSLYDVKINGIRIYDRFVEQGVPKAAVERVFEFLDINGGKTVKVRAKIRGRRTYMADRDVKIKDRYAAIIDYTLPSDERRLYVMDLKKGTVSKHFVAHGKGSGVTVPGKFSNIDGSKMTSLGLYLAGDTYRGKHGESLNLYGLEPSNNKAAARDIVMHSAKYVSEEYAKSQGRLGRSWGCPAVAPGIIKKMINTFEEGGLIYAYHKELTASVTKNPNVQVVTVDKDGHDIDLPGEEETMSKGQPEATPVDNSEILAALGKVHHIPIPEPRPDMAPATIEQIIENSTPAENKPVIAEGTTGPQAETKK